MRGKLSMVSINSPANFGNSALVRPERERPRSFAAGKDSFPDDFRRARIEVLVRGNSFCSESGLQLGWPGNRGGAEQLGTLLPARVRNGPS